MEKRDVVIVGGGLAGLTTAKYLAEEGIDFVLLEEHTEFFKKPCGEGVLQSSPDFDFFDIYGSKIGLEKEVNEVEFIIGNRKLLLPIHFSMIDKKRVEEELANQIKKMGGEIKMGEKVKKIQKNILYPQKISARIIVGADGALSIVRKNMGVPPPRLGVAVEGHLDNLEDANSDEHKAYIWFGKSVVPEGYAWAFPRKDFWNVGIGTAKKFGFSQYVEKFKSKFKYIKNLRGASIPFSLPVKTYGRNFVLVGDAASQILTAVGAGNLTATICGYLAARTISKEIRKSDPDLSLYEREWKKYLKKLFRQSYRIYRMARFISYRNDEFAYRLIKLMMRLFAIKPID